MEKEKKLFSGTLLLGISAVFGKMLSLFLLPFFTAKLSPSAFGVTEIFITTAVLLMPLFSLYAPQSTFRFLAGGARGAVRAGAVLLTAGLLLLAGFVPLLGRFESLRAYRLLLYFYVCASLLRSFLAHILRAKGRFEIFALQQSFCALFTALLQVFFLLETSLGAVGYLLGIVLGDAVTFFILLLYFLLFRERETRPEAALYGKMLRFSLPLIPAALLWWGMGAIEKYFLLYYHGETSMGLYAVASRFPALIGFGAGIFMEVWHYAALQGEREREGVLFGRIYAALLPFLILSGAAVSVLSPLLISGALSGSYGEAVRAVGLLSFGAVCGALSTFLDSIYTLRLSSLYSMLTALCAAAINPLLCYWLVPRLGIVGAAAAGALSFAALFWLRLWHTARLLAFPRYRKRSAISLALLFFCGCLMAGKHVVFATVMALIAVLPVVRLFREGSLLLYKRLRILLRHTGKGKEYSSPKRKV